LKTLVKIIFLTFIFCFLSHCTDRKRLNPIDPQNPETGGRLRGLRIYSEQDRVVIQWKQLQLKDIQGFRIYRKQDSDLPFNPIHLAPPDSNQFIDYGLVYNKKYDYFVTILGGDFETPGSDTVSIIPGPTIIWATDVYNRRILKISHDGAHEIKQIAVDGYPWALAYDNENNVLWYTDVFLNRVYNIKSQTAEIVLDISYGEPIDLVMDKSNDRVWVADETQGKIFVFNRQGEKVGEKGGFERPVSIDCFLSDGSCWIADSKTKTVTKISNTLQTIVQIKDLIDPTSIAINQLSGDCWVADSSRILYFDIKGRLKLTIASQVSFPRYLAVDSESGNCWILDFSFFASQSRLFCFNNDGDKLLEIPGFSWPENLKINPYDQSCIVTDSGAGRILKISLDGTIIGQITGYDYTRGLFIEF
jgi:DNA-binding beta-propeller fold protein YncE